MDARTMEIYLGDRGFLASLALPTAVDYDTLQALCDSLVKSSLRLQEPLRRPGGTRRNARTQYAGRYLLMIAALYFLRFRGGYRFQLHRPPDLGHCT